MIKKYFIFKWTKERREAFEKIKESIVEAPTLWSLNFDKEFILYTFAFNHSIVDVLQREVLYMPVSTDSWYNDLKYYLTHGSSPNHLDARKK